MENRIIFSTPTMIDYRTLTTLGVSVKETSEPIGKFGTGFKYSLAWLLANGHKVTVVNRYEETFIDSVEFTVKQISIRSINFPVIFATTNYGDEYQLSFTTEIGKNMTPEEVLRELIANTLDENGDYHFVAEGETFLPTSTTIEITCPEDSALFLAKKFVKHILWDDLPGTVIYADDYHKVKLCKTAFCYFRGVFLANHEEFTSQFAINLNTSAFITDNRSIAKARRIEILHKLTKKSPEIFLPILAFSNEDDGACIIYFEKSSLTPELYSTIEKLEPELNNIPDYERTRLQKQLLQLWDNYSTTKAMEKSNYANIARKVVKKLEKVFKTSPAPNIKINISTDNSDYSEETNTLQISLHTKDMDPTLFSLEVIQSYMQFITYRKDEEGQYKTGFGSTNVTMLFIAQLLGLYTGWDGTGHITPKPVEEETLSLRERQISLVEYDPDILF